MNDVAQQGRTRRRWAGGLIALAAAVLAAGCTAPADDAVETVVVSTVEVAAAGSTQPETTAPPTSQVVVPPLPGASDSDTTGPASSAPDTSATPSEATASSQVSPTSASRTATTTTTTTPPKPKPKPTKVGIVPANGATGVDPLDRIVVSASGGVIQYAAVTTPAGRKLGGTLNKAKSVWTLNPELGYDRLYTVNVTARAADGTVTRTESVFRTVAADDLAQVIQTVPKAGSTVGVGQPIVIHFSQAFPTPEGRREVERNISVKASTPQPGAFRWFSDTELHWRPAMLWKAGSEVTVDIDIYGKDLRDGTWGGDDRIFRFKVARKMVAVVDAKSHTMVIYRNDKPIQRWPVSLGTDKYPTYNGTHIVTEKHATKVMDSRTWGLTGAGAYRTTVKWATRISASGEFVHGAPWSEYAQGNANVSHGCINVSDSRARWFYENFIAGDPVIVRNSTGPDLEPWDGYGDWQIPITKY